MTRFNALDKKFLNNFEINALKKDVKNDQRRARASEVLPRERAVLLLPRRVPDRELQLRTVGKRRRVRHERAANRRLRRL